MNRMLMLELASILVGFNLPRSIARRIATEAAQEAARVMDDKGLILRNVEAEMAKWALQHRDNQRRSRRA